MYAGQIAEAGPIEDVLAAPRHPYTQLLLSAVPDPKAPPPGLETLAAATGERGEPPKVIDPKPGCRFRPRCPVAIDECEMVTPELRELRPGSPLAGNGPDTIVPAARQAACHVAASGAEVRAFS
jgi:peptide/nickel transport system ATP-binding protein